MNTEKKIKVGILGATGMVGQRFITLLTDHPWFEIKVLAASAKSAGKFYKTVIADRWKIDVPVPDAISDMIIMDVNQIDEISKKVDMVFSAVDMSKEEIQEIEYSYAKNEIPVVSNNSAHRWTEDVPMLIPEINDNHCNIIEAQKKRLGTKKGFIAVKPNCSIQSYVPMLAAWSEFEPYELAISTYQAISGAGKTFKEWPEMIENIIPYIDGEEEKSEREPLKVLGEIVEDKFVDKLDLKITCQCIRVPVLNGHTASVFIKFKKKPTLEQLVEKARNFKGYPQYNFLPSAPKQFIHYLVDDDRPQVKLDVDRENGMAVSLGRLRVDEVYDFKFIGLAHNTLRGAAGGAVLCGETLVSKGYITSEK